MPKIKKADPYKIFFDVDYTLLAVDGSLRPGVKNVLQRLKDDGYIVYIWSGNGIRWRDMRKHNLESVIEDCLEKPVIDYVRIVKNSDYPVAPDLVVDDHLEVVSAFGGVWARSYYFPNSCDSEMEHIYRVISEWRESGKSSDSRFRNAVEWA